jgi:hypothetical protein
MKFEYRVEEYDAAVPTGRSWVVEATGPIEAAMEAMDLQLSGSGKPGQMRAKVVRLGQSSAPEIVHLYDIPNRS